MSRLVSGPIFIVSENLHITHPLASVSEPFQTILLVSYIDVSIAYPKEAQPKERLVIIVMILKSFLVSQLSKTITTEDLHSRAVRTRRMHVSVAVSKIYGLFDKLAKIS